jgi:hypothetical protein
MAMQRGIAVLPLGWQAGAFLQYYAIGVYVLRVEIVRTKRYLKDLKRIGATEGEISSLEQAIATDPNVGDVVPGLRGVRKVRFALGGKGKRGGGRAIYYVLASDDAAIMIFAYAKSRQSDLTEDEKRSALALVRELNDEQN